jgi:chemotaxis protein methyltransferase CheR
MGAVLNPATADETHLLGEEDFALACRLIAQYAGIKLSVHKRFMVHNRLARRLRARGVRSFSEYLGLVQSEDGEREAFVNALTTNLTAFFREPHHFEMLAAHAARHRAATREPLRVWCCACSTGEEAWSAAMTLREARCPGEIVASDIDTDALAAASAGVYTTTRAEAIGIERLRAHWLRGVDANEGWVNVRPQMRSMVRFVQLNLLGGDWPALEPFDAIFCRNVAIYFDRDAQRRMLARFDALLKPGGLLFVGHAESFPAGHPAFRSCGRTAYQHTGR